VTAGVKSHKGKVAAALDRAKLCSILIKEEILEGSFGISLLTWPFKSVGPGEVAEPIADKVGVTSVDENRNLLEKTRNKTVERLHPITLEEEVAVDVKVAAVVFADLGTESFHDILTVEVLAYPV